MIEFMTSGKNDNFGKPVSATMSLKASQNLKTFPMTLVQRGDSSVQHARRCRQLEGVANPVNC